MTIARQALPPTAAPDDLVAREPFSGGCLQEGGVFVDHEFCNENTAKPRCRTVARVSPALAPEEVFAEQLLQRRTAAVISRILEKRLSSAMPALVSEKARKLLVPKAAAVAKTAASPVGLLANISARKLLTERLPAATALHVRVQLAGGRLLHGDIFVDEECLMEDSLNVNGLNDKKCSTEKIKPSSRTVARGVLPRAPPVLPSEEIDALRLLEESLGKENGPATFTEKAKKLLVPKAAAVAKIAAMPVGLLAKISARKAATVSFFSEDIMGPPIKKCRLSAGFTAPSAKLTPSQVGTPCRAGLRDITNMQGAWCL